MVDTCRKAASRVVSEPAINNPRRRAASAASEEEEERGSEEVEDSSIHPSRQGTPQPSDPGICTIHRDLPILSAGGELSSGAATGEISYPSKIKSLITMMRRE
ncbi:hypothetical protein QYE76_002608 [Lolium multiflorum]|uniref:Uncharacterized protein n=1 Tax=Lolium multiflorum TaxID=4521 RepID=A0AAD8W0G5_LOLMU|nr:hypothetical protein QYE76_002608 [Lolium multiflorum]